MFNPLALSNATKDMGDTYEDHEKIRSAAIMPDARIIEVEKETFTPAILRCSGCASPEASCLFSTIVAKLAVKRSETNELETYQKSVSFVKRRVAFDLLKTCIISLRGDRRFKRNDPIQDLDYGLKEMNLYQMFYCKRVFM